MRPDPDQHCLSLNNLKVFRVVVSLARQHGLWETDDPASLCSRLRRLLWKKDQADAQRKRSLF